SRCGFSRIREGDSTGTLGAMDAAARALLDDRRARIAEELKGEPGLDVQELSRRLGLHPNTIRWHLGVLADAGLVGSERAARRTPGRPRVLYRLRPSPAA